MIYLLLIILVLAVVIIMYVPQFSTIRAKMFAALAAIGAIIATWAADSMGWISGMFGG